MGYAVGFPAVPTKSRIASKLVAIMYCQKGKASVDWAISSYAITAGVATITTSADASSDISADDLVFIYGTGTDELDGLQKVTSITTTTIVIDELDDNTLATSGSVSPADAGIINYDNFTVTSQISDFSTNETASTESYSAIGTLSEEEPGATSRPVTATAWPRDGLEQLAPMLGTDATKLTMDKTQLGTGRVHFLVTRWSGRTTTDKMQHYKALVGVQWNDIQDGDSADANAEWTLTGDATEIFSKVMHQSDT